MDDWRPLYDHSLRLIVVRAWQPQAGCGREPPVLTFKEKENALRKYKKERKLEKKARLKQQKEEQDLQREYERLNPPQEASAEAPPVGSRIFSAEDIERSMASAPAPARAVYASDLEQEQSAPAPARAVYVSELEEGQRPVDRTSAAHHTIVSGLTVARARCSLSQAAADRTAGRDGPAAGHATRRAAVAADLPLAEDPAARRRGAVRRTF